MRRPYSSRRPNRGFRGERKGSILFLAVGAVAILTILAAGASSSVSQEWKMASFLTDANTSSDYALSALRAMKQVWSARPSPLTMTPYDLRSRDLVLDDKIVSVRSFDEEALVNIMKSSHDTLLQLPGISGNETLLAAILATPLHVKEDLLLAEGVTVDVYALLKDLVTVYGNGRVNINTVSPEVLTVLDAPVDLISRIRQYRAGDDGEEGTVDDRVFDDISRIDDDLEPFGLMPQEREWIQTLVLAQRLTTGSGTIRCEMTLIKGERILRHFRITVDLSTGTILRWDEE
ncbi:MAG: type II secretion system protein GspK [Candidatus Omnitrophica bacterium]|nr:type II secretion system protein GspK [Candidatus Omnitrophota bacterium]